MKSIRRFRMGGSLIRYTVPGLWLALCFPLPPLAGAQEPDLQLPISMHADSFNYDGKNSMLIYRGLQLSQGTISIKADLARASSLDFEDSVWHLSGNVVLDVQQGHVECETADLRFADNQLEFAEIAGSPATFSMRRPDSDVVTHAEAGKLAYDFLAGTIEFSDNATITEGPNQISSNYLLYNIKEQRISARSAGKGKEKVKIEYTPQANPDTGDEDSSRQNEEETGEPDDRDGDR